LLLAKVVVGRVVGQDGTPLSSRGRAAMAHVEGGVEANDVAAWAGEARRTAQIGRALPPFFLPPFLERPAYGDRVME
jgi:hypothetical protein